MFDSQRKTANLFRATIEQGTITINGDIAVDNRIRTKEYINIDSNYITLSWNSEQNTEAYIMMYDANGDYVRGEGWSTSPATKTILSNVKKIRIIWRYASQADILPSAVNSVMLVSGQTPLPYEPYWQHSLRKLGTSTDTLTTLPSDLYADGNNATVGLVGNMSQTGTPTPTTPIQPQETGDRTGNLFDYTAEYDVGQNTYNYTISGLDPNKYYTCSTNFERISGVNTASLYFGGGRSDINGVWSDTPRTFKPNSRGEIVVYIRYVEADGAPPIIDDVIAGTIWVMVNEGSTALPYEPYGYKIPISSANTTTPVYLGEVETTRKIKKYEFTGNENWVRTSSGYFYSGNAISDYNNRLFAITTLCSHYMSVINATNGSALNDGEMCLYSSFSGSAHEVYIKDNTYSTAEDFKIYLQQQYAAGTPVCVWYVLATETTGILNEPLRKIGKYADTVSGITIPTVTGADSFDVLTTLKPSEVELTYTGWHDAEVEEWDGSQWQ